MFDRERFRFLGQAIIATYLALGVAPWYLRPWMAIAGPFILTFHMVFNTQLFKAYYRMHLIMTNQMEKL